MQPRIVPAALVLTAVAAALGALLLAGSLAAGCGGAGDTICVPPAGSLKGGYEVRINGEGFQKGVTVEFGPKTIRDVKYVGENAIAVTAPPADDEGPVDIILTNPDGKRMKFEKAFTYTAVPGMDTEPGKPVSAAPAGSAATVK